MEEAPLSGLRVLEIGHLVAAPLAGVLLADQGAEVVRVVRAGRPSWSPPTTAVLARGKRTLRADLEDPAERKRVLALAADCDVVVSNVRPATLERLGLGAEAVGAVNPGAVHVAIPGFGHGDPRRGEGGWDTTISAACGFFTDLSIRGAAVGAPPIFTPLPLPSVYAGMHAAVAAVAAVHGGCGRDTGTRSRCRCSTPRCPRRRASSTRLLGSRRATTRRLCRGGCSTRSRCGARPNGSCVPCTRTSFPR